MAQVFGTEMSEYELVKFWRNATLVNIPRYVRAFSSLVRGRYEAIEATKEVANLMANDWDDILNKVVTDYDIYDEIAIDGAIKINSWFDLCIRKIAENAGNKEFERIVYEFHIAIISYEEFLACMIQKYISEADFNKYIEAEAMREWADILED